ncbi:hypothetical protein ABEP42_27150 [Priestia megaterium]|uniref:hypothetical protein n=1 Tax=Priestia megaterium TaxID=1404 RepID=UPI00317758C9
MESIEKIKRDTEELTQQIIADRLARGLPEEPPPDFLPVSIAAVLGERLSPLRQVIVKYAKLVSDSGKLITIDVSKFDGYLDDLQLMRYTVEGGVGVGAFAIGLSTCLREIKEISEALSNGKEQGKTPQDATKRLYLSLKLCEDVPSYADAYDCLLDIRFEEQIADARNQYEEYLADEALFQADLAKYREHYESIKHLY